MIMSFPRDKLACFAVQRRTEEVIGGGRGKGGGEGHGKTDARTSFPDKGYGRDTCRRLGWAQAFFSGFGREEIEVNVKEI